MRFHQDHGLWLLRAHPKASEEFFKPPLIALFSALLEGRLSEIHRRTEQSKPKEEKARNRRHDRKLFAHPHVKPLYIAKRENALVRFEGYRFQESMSHFFA